MKSKKLEVNMLTKIQTGIAALLLACAAHAAPPTQVPITRAELGAQWPLTVETGVVGCERGKAIKFVAGGKTYALNGTAQSYSKQLGFGWQTVASIWRDNPEIPGTKVPIGVLIAKGQALCQPWP